MRGATQTPSPPRPLQPRWRTHCGSAQPGPAQPGSQWQMPGGSQLPCPLQLSAAVVERHLPSIVASIRLCTPLEPLTEQSPPAQPATHWHLPGATHSPWREHALSHSGSEQSWPCQPASHAHVAGPVQLPWAEHGVAAEKQSGVAQPAPPQPGTHLHRPGATHTPCIEQSEGQMGSSHACPFQPASQPQPVAPHLPWPEQMAPSVCSMPA